MKKPPRKPENSRQGQLPGVPEKATKARRTLPHVRGSATSRAAARSMEPVAAAQEGRVLALFRQRRREGCTDDELEVYLGERHQSVSARRRALEQRGLIMKTEGKRPTRSGRAAYVYVLTIAGARDE